MIRDALSPEAKTGAVWSQATAEQRIGMKFPQWECIWVFIEEINSGEATSSRKASQPEAETTGGSDETGWIPSRSFNLYSNEASQCPEELIATNYGKYHIKAEDGSSSTEF